LLLLVVIPVFLLTDVQHVFRTYNYGTYLHDMWHHVSHVNKTYISMKTRAVKQLIVWINYLNRHCRTCRQTVLLACQLKMFIVKLQPQH